MPHYLLSYIRQYKYAFDNYHYHNQNDCAGRVEAIMILSINGQIVTLLTTAEVAARLGVSERRVRALIAARRVGSKIGGTWLVREDELPSLIPGPGHWPKGRPRKPKA